MFRRKNKEANLKSSKTKRDNPLLFDTEPIDFDPGDLEDELNALMGDDISPPSISPPSHHPPRKSGGEMALDYLEAPTHPSLSAKSKNFKSLKIRLEQYKSAAIKARDSGNLARTKELMVAVQAVQEVVDAGEDEYDGECMPPPPEQFHINSDENEKEEESNQPGPSTPSAKPANQIPPLATSDIASKESLSARILFLQHLYNNTEDSSKKNMFSRTLLTYKQALKAYEMGVKYDYTQLYALPGCPQFTKVAQLKDGSASGSVAQAPANPIQSPSQNPTNSVIASTAQHQQRTVELLQKRQLELRTAAAQAKAKGDLDLAKAFLRDSMSMNNMIRAATAGLSVDLKQLPKPPGARMSVIHGFAASKEPILSGKVCPLPVEFQTELINAQTSDTLCDLLIKTLALQVEEASVMSKNHREAGLTDLGDKFYDLEDVCRKWIAFVTAYKHQGRVPSYSFEEANLSKLNMNPDLGDDILEVTVVRGIQFCVPPEISGPEKLDTWVQLELTFPVADSPQQHATAWAKHTNEPTDFGGFQASARFQVNRKSKGYMRLLQGSKSVKATVYYSRGVLKKNGVLGTVNAKLNELMNSATATACYDLMDGRKAVGGLLELRFRHRNPVQGSQFTPYHKPWLTISSSKSAKSHTIKRPEQAPPSH